MQILDIDGTAIHYRDEGPKDAPAVVFANSLGTDFRLWDKVVARLHAAFPEGLRMIRYDKRGHGLSDCPKGPYSMGTLVRDAEQLLDHLEVKDSLFVGLSIGGMIAQGLAVKRLDLVRAMVLSNTAAKIGQPEMWDDRIATVKKGGIAPMADGILERWFHKEFRASSEFPAWRNMLIQQSVEGYAGCCAAISGTDFYTPTSGLRLPTLGIGGSDDGSTPPDLIRETVNLIPGSRFELIRRAGHLPCVEQPDTFADLLTQFIKETGHV